MGAPGLLPAHPGEVLHISVHLLGLSYRACCVLAAGWLRACCVLAVWSRSVLCVLAQVQTLRAFRRAGLFDLRDAGWLSRALGCWLLAAGSYVGQGLKRTKLQTLCCLLVAS